MTRNDVSSGRIQHPIAWKHAQTGHFDLGGSGGL